MTDDLQPSPGARGTGRARLPIPALLRSHWSLLVWLFAVGFALYFFFHGARFGALRGVVDAVAGDLAPVEVGRVKEVLVTQGQAVSVGAPVVCMDTSLIDAEIAVQEALLSEARQSVAVYQQDIMQTDERLADSLAAAEAKLLAVKAQQAMDRSELEFLAAEAHRLESLLKIGGAAMPDIILVLARHKALERSVALSADIVAAHERYVAGARERSRLFREYLKSGEGRTADALQKKTELHIEYLVRQLDSLRARRAACELTCVRAGTVSRIFKVAGEVVPAAEPIVRIVEPEVRTITGFVPESNAHEVERGMRAYVSRYQGGGPTHAAHVTIVAPEMLGLPANVSPIPNRPIRGRRIVLAFEEENFDFLPGETVRIHLRPSLRTWFTRR